MDLENLTLAQFTRRQLLVRAGMGGVTLAGADLLMSCASAVNGGKSSKTPTPKAGGVAMVAIGADILPADVFSVNGQNITFTRMVFNTLTELDHKTLQPKPSLATSWDVSADGLTHTFQLRTDVKFHSARPFGPDDVIFAITNLQNPDRGSQLLRTAAVVTDMSASGANAVKLHLAHPVSNLFDLLETMYIIDKESLPDLLDGKNAVGTGPFKWQSWTPGTSLQLVKNTSYWKPNRPYLDGVTLLTIADPTALTDSIKTKQTNFSSNVGNAGLTELSKLPGYFVSTVDTFADDSYLGINTANPPFDKKEVRQAVGWALDRKRLLTQAFRNQCCDTAIPWPQQSPAYDASLANLYHHDLGKAKSLLNQAGVGPFTTEIAINVPNDPVAQIVQFNLSQIGITANPKLYAGGSFFGTLRAGKFPGLWSSGHLFANMHPATLLTAALPFNSLHNSSNFHDPTYQQLVQQAWVATSDAELKTAYRAITKLLADEAFVLELNAGGDIYAGTDSFNGWTVNMYDYTNFDEAFLA